ncbi:hypothetical protein DPMN_097728 [Dreissena polymorpha]|uniref:Uncharacterized protein n=1 Tax=Dreissena polymorpha TaxID=45954 RepID=A0A9D4R4U0_DREPO|nr:hypothetical protein DPMN_097728 [Dreissena polymorpha]
MNLSDKTLPQLETRDFLGIKLVMGLSLNLHLAAMTQMRFKKLVIIKKLSSSFVLATFTLSRRSPPDAGIPTYCMVYCSLDDHQKT